MQLDEMFESYKRNEITFTKEVVKAIGLVQKQLFIRYGNTRKPCYLHSASLTNAKLMVRMNPLDLETITNRYRQSSSDRSREALCLAVCLDVDERDRKRLEAPLLAARAIS